MAARSRRTEILDTAAGLFATSGMRMSMKSIADASGILPGSLYHHFESKDAMFTELVRRYRDDLHRLASQALDTLDRLPSLPATLHAIQFGEQIASYAVKHRAAVLLTLYEQPGGATSSLAELGREAQVAVDNAMQGILDRGHVTGEIRPAVDAALLAERLTRSMLHHGIGDSYLQRESGVPEIRCRLLLEGLAAGAVSYDELDRSDALGSVREFVATWRANTEQDEIVDRIRSVARAEFSRRGYEATTIRQISSAAGVKPAVLYRLFESKESLLVSVMRSYTEQRRLAWDIVLSAASSPIEKLDALTWLNIAVLNRFLDEFRVQLGWVRESPPNLSKLGSTAAQRRGIQGLLVAGARSGEIAFDYGSVEARAGCVFEACWTPESIVCLVGTDRAHALARETLLAGAIYGADIVRLQ